jgi:hypothetical protein
MTTRDIYTVQADRDTGAWIGQPVATGSAMPVADWLAIPDTDDTHYDTYDHDGTTRLIAVKWVD